MLEQLIERIHRNFLFRVILFVLLSFLIFGHTLPFGFFIFDDALHIKDNAFMSHVSFQKIHWFWGNSITPLVFNLWQAISYFFKNNNALPFRFANILVHGFNASLIFILLYRYLSLFFINRENPTKTSHYLRFGFPALTGAIFYLIHPVQVESVVWISSFRTLTSTFFALLSIYFQLNSYDKKNAETNYKSLTTSLVFFILALLCKPSPAALPLLFLFQDYFLQRKKIKTIFLDFLPYLIFAIIFIALHSGDLLSRYLLSINFFDRILVVGDSLFHYFKSSFFMTDHLFDYHLTLKSVFERYSDEFSRYMLYVALFIGLDFLLIPLFKKDSKFRPISISMVIFVILISVNLGFLPYDFQNISTVADRFLNLPLLGISLFISILIFELMEKRFRIKGGNFLTSFILLILILPMLSTFTYSRSWESSYTVLEKSFLKNKKDFSLNMSLAQYFFNERQYEKSEKHYYLALNADKNSFSPIHGLIQVFRHYPDQNKIRSFLLYLKHSQKVLPPNFGLQIAELFMILRDFSTARTYVIQNKKIGLDPAATDQLLYRINEQIKRKTSVAYKTIGDHFYDQGNFLKAKKQYLEAIKIDPQNVEIKNLLEALNEEFEGIR